MPKTDNIQKELFEDYALRRSLQKKNLQVQEELEEEINRLESEYINTKLIPELAAFAEKLLEGLECEVYLAVTNGPNGRVEIEDEFEYRRGGKGSELLSKLMEDPDPKVEHKAGGQCRKTEKAAPKTGLCVFMPDGTFIQDKVASQTFIHAIEKAGLDKVRQLGLKFCNVPIVSNTKDAKYGLEQHQTSQGLYILTHSNTQRKAKMLSKISDALHLDWKIEIVK